MHKFKYTILDNNKRKRQGEIEGEDINIVAKSFIDQGFTILDLKKAGFSLAKLKSLNIGKVPLKDKVLFMRQMSFMINAGLPLTQALEIAENQIQNFKLKEVVKEILRDVEGGTALSKAMGKHDKTFENVVINLIRAGEESGKLDMILERVADDLEKKQEFNSKVKGAMIYPVIILVAIVAVVAMLLVFMIPEMKKLFEDKGDALPTATQWIISASDFLRGIGGIAVLLGLIAVVVGVVYYRRTPSGRLVTDNILLKMPIFGQLISKSQIASFSRTFSMLISSGVPILDALRLVSESTTNQVFVEVLQNARNKVEKGVPLSQPILASDAFPPIVGHMVKVGEETGKMDEVIAKVGTQYAKEVDQMASNLTKLMEPLILIVMGIVIGILAIAVYLPIFNLGETVSKI